LTVARYAAPKFLDSEDIKLEQSEIRIGHSPNGIWAYALGCNYGAAGAAGRYVFLQEISQPRCGVIRCPG
jgi:hypothetical protein